MTATLRGLAGLCLFLLALMGEAGQAQAHATLVSSHPDPGAVLEQAPERVQLQFNEPVSVTALRLVDADGQSHAGLTFDLRGPTLAITLPEGLRSGTQTLSYRIVSADGHPVGGTLTFSIGQPGRAQELTSQGAGREIILWLLRVAIYICLIGGVGAAVFRSWVSPAAGPARGLLWVLATGFIALMLSVGIQGLDLLDLGWLDLVGLAPWEAAAKTSYGVMAGLAAVSLTLAASSLNEPRPGRLRLQTGLALILAGLALASTGHAATAPPQWLMRPAVFLHVIAAAFWAGALVPLLWLLRREPGAAGLALARFSASAVWFVAVLILAGGILATVQLEKVSALFETAYGRILSAKLCAVLALLALAGLNRARLMPAIERGEGRARIWLGRSIAAEIALMVLVTCLVAGWRFTPPPRNLAAELPAMVHLHGERLMVMAYFDPGRVGRNGLKLEILDATYVPFDPKEVNISFAPADGSLEPIETKARRIDQGFWQVEGVYIPVAGTWTVTVGALVSDFERVELSSEYAFNR